MDAEQLAKLGMACATILLHLSVCSLLAVLCKAKWTCFDVPSRINSDAADMVRQKTSARPCS